MGSGCAKENHNQRKSHHQGGVVFLPIHDPLRGKRAKEVAAAKEKYRFKDNGGCLPNHIDVLPDDEDFPPSNESFSYFGSRKDAVVNMVISKLWSTFDPLDTMQDFEDFFNTKKLSAPQRVVERWRLDEEFGYQRLNGVNPLMIEACKVIPKKLKITEGDVAHLIAPETLSSLCAEGRLFVCDYEALDGIPVREGCTVAAPVALFWTNASGENLRPLAIQASQDSSASPLFVPPEKDCTYEDFKNDPKQLTWFFARMLVANADAQMHQFHFHYVHTHLLVEAMYVAMRRTMSVRHPIYEMLRAHFTLTLAINEKARELLVSEDGVLEQCFGGGHVGATVSSKRAWSKFNWDERHPIEDFRKRGVLDNPMLKEYYFRDDAILVYNAIEEFVEEAVDGFYKDDAAVDGDTELQDWRKEMTGAKGGSIYSIPLLKSRAALVKFLSQTIYVCTVGHAAVNFPQYEFFAFVPNYPLTLRGGIPSSLTAIACEKDLVKRLPNWAETSRVVALAHFLVQKADSQMGDYASDLGYEPSSAVLQKAQSTFRHRLEKVTHTITRRNQKVGSNAYPYLLPANVPNSIAI